MEFKNIRIKELPSSNPDPTMVAPLDPGWRALYNGLDLRGWRNADAAKARWTANDWQLTLQSGADATKHTLWTETEFADAEFTLDVKPGADAAGDTAPAILVRGADGRGTEINLADVAAGKWTRVIITTKGNEAVVQIGGKEVRRLPVSSGASGALGLRDTGASMEFGNLHVRSL